jgi:hypothetical protein
MVKFKCEGCGKACSRYKSEYDQSKHHFCSRGCQGGRVEFKCEGCGKICSRTKSEYDGSKHHHCSVECRDQGKRIKFKCEGCGKVCSRIKSEYSKSKHYFCSKGCRKQSKNVEFKCESCDKVCSQPKSQYDRGKHHYCGQTCSANSIKKQAKLRWGDIDPRRYWAARYRLKKLETKLGLKISTADFQNRWEVLRRHLKKHPRKFELRRNGVPDGGWCETKVGGDVLSANQILFAFQREIQGKGPLLILWHESKQAQIDWHLKKGTTATLFSSPVDFWLNRNGKVIK